MPQQTRTFLLMTINTSPRVDDEFASSVTWNVVVEGNDAFATTCDGSIIVHGESTGQPQREISHQFATNVQSSVVLVGKCGSHTDLPGDVRLDPPS